MMKEQLKNIGLTLLVVFILAIALTLAGNI